MAGIVGLKAGGQDHGAHIEIEFCGGLAVGQGAGLALFDALHALGTNAAVDAPLRLGHGGLFVEAQIDFLKRLGPVAGHGGHSGPGLFGLVVRNGIPHAILNGTQGELPIGL